MSDPRFPIKHVDAARVAVRACVGALNHHEWGEAEKQYLLWRVCQVLEISKDLRPCCPNDVCECCKGKHSKCWACWLNERAPEKKP